MLSKSEALIALIVQDFAFSLFVLFSEHNLDLNLGCSMNISSDWDCSFPCCWLCKYLVALKAFRGFIAGRRCCFCSLRLVSGSACWIGWYCSLIVNFATFDGSFGRRTCGSCLSSCWWCFGCSCLSFWIFCRRNYCLSPFWCLLPYLVAREHWRECWRRSFLSWPYWKWCSYSPFQVMVKEDWFQTLKLSLKASIEKLSSQVHYY